MLIAGVVLILTGCFELIRTRHMLKIIIALELAIKAVSMVGTATPCLTNEMTCVFPGRAKRPFGQRTPYCRKGPQSESSGDVRKPAAGMVCAMTSPSALGHAERLST